MGALVEDAELWEAARPDGDEADGADQQEDLALS